MKPVGQLSGGMPLFLNSANITLGYSIVTILGAGTDREIFHIVTVGAGGVSEQRLLASDVRALAPLSPEPPPAVKDSAAEVVKEVLRKTKVPADDTYKDR